MGSGGQEAEKGSRSRSRSRSSCGSGSESRYGSGLVLGSRTVSLDNVGVQIQGERSSRKKEFLEDKRGQNPGVNEEQHFWQFKVVQLCVQEVRKRIEEHFGSKEVPEKLRRR